MPLVAGLSVITLLSTLFLDRSLTKGQRVKKKKR
jgi:hypothetical protein